MSEQEKQQEEKGCLMVMADPLYLGYDKNVAILNFLLVS